MGRVLPSVWPVRSRIITHRGRIGEAREASEDLPLPAFGGLSRVTCHGVRPMNDPCAGSIAGAKHQRSQSKPLHSLYIACVRPLKSATTTSPTATAGLQMPQTSIRLPSNSSVCRNTFSSHGFSPRSKITKWPASAPHRSM